MISVTNKSIGFMHKSVTSPTSPKSSTINTVDADGNFNNIIESKNGSLIYDDLGLNELEAIYKEAFVLRTKFEFNDEKYEAILQKQGNTYKPVKVYQRDGEQLKEVEVFDFKNGKDGDYHNVEDINKFISAIIFTTENETPKEYFKPTEETIAFINQNIEQQNKKTVVVGNAQNIDGWVKHLSSSLAISDYDSFKAEVKQKFKEFHSYVGEERIEKIVNKYSDMIENGSFKGLSQDSITRVTMSDLPTLKRIKSGQIDTEKKSSHEARNKMLTTFLAKGTLKVDKVDATNFIVGGISKTSIPVFYTSSIYSDNGNTFKFKEKSEAAKAEISKQLGKSNSLSALREFILKNDKENGNKLYLYTYLASVRDSLFKTTDAQRREAWYAAAEKLIKDSEPDSKIDTELYFANKEQDVEKRKTAFIRAVTATMISARASCVNDLKIDLSATAKSIKGTSFGQELPIESFYENKKQVFQFEKNAGLELKNEEPETYYGASIVGEITMEEKNGNFVAKSFKRYSYKTTGYEEIGNILNKITKLDQTGKLVYTSITEDFEQKKTEYDFNLSKNLDNLLKSITKNFASQDGQLYKTQEALLGVSIAKIEEMKRLVDEKGVTSDVITQIQNTISGDKALMKLVEIGEMKKSDFNTVRTNTILMSNAGKITRHINKYGGSLIQNATAPNSLKYPKYMEKNPDEARSIASKAVVASFLDIAKSLKMSSFRKGLLNNPEKTLEELRSSGASNGYFKEKFYNNEVMESIRNSGAFSLEKFIRNTGELIGTKYTGATLPSTISNVYKSLINEVYYPTKDGEFTTATQKDILQLVFRESQKTSEAVREIREEINNEYQQVKDGRKTETKPSYGFAYQAQKTESKEKNTEVPQTLDDDMIIPMEDTVDEVKKEKETPKAVAPATVVASTVAPVVAPVVAEEEEISIDDIIEYEIPVENEVSAKVEDALEDEMEIEEDIDALEEKEPSLLSALEDEGTEIDIDDIKELEEELKENEDEMEIDNDAPNPFETLEENDDFDLDAELELRDEFEELEELKIPTHEEIAKKELDNVVIEDYSVAPGM